MITFGIRHHHLLDTIVGYIRVPGAHSMMSVRKNFTAEQIFQEISGYPTREISELVAVEVDLAMTWIWDLMDRLAFQEIEMDTLEICFDDRGDIVLRAELKLMSNGCSTVFELVREPGGYTMSKLSASCPDQKTLSSILQSITSSGLSDAENSDLAGLGCFGPNLVVEQTDEIFASLTRLKVLVAA